MPYILIDVTLPVTERLPVWPGDPPVAVTRVADGLPRVSRLSMSVHAGTHVDAPAHFFVDGASVETLPLELLVGPAWVVHLAGHGLVTASLLGSAAIPEGMRRLLIRTDNSDRTAGEFDPNFVSLSSDAAEWLLAHSVRLVGIDGPSIEPYTAPGDPLHRSLLAAGVIVIENLALAGVAPGAYDLICLPLPIAGCDGAPARVVLRRTADT